MPVLKEPSSALSHPFKGVKKWHLRSGHTTTGYDGVHIHFHDEMVKYGCAMKKLHSRVLEGRNDWKMTSSNWAKKASPIRWLAQAWCCSHTYKSRDMDNSDFHMELRELLMGKRRNLISQQWEAAQGTDGDGERVAEVAAEPQAALSSSVSN